MPPPVKLSPESSSLSSALTDATAHIKMLSDINKKLASYQSSSTSDYSVIVLKAFTEHLPQDGMRNICDDILNCGSNEELCELATHLVSALLVPMKARGMTPVVSPSPRFGAGDTTDEIASELESSSRNDQEWLKEACLLRDNNRCVLTGFYDVKKAAENLSETERKQNATIRTEAAHIIPLSIGKFANTKLRHTTIIWDALYRYFPGIRSRINFSANKINNTCNAITLSKDLHIEFGEFQLAFEPTHNENVYRVELYPGFSTAYNQNLPKSGTITFATDSYHSLPSAILLETHATIAKILHATGMGEYIDNVLQERQRTRCFAPDGSTNVQSLLMVF